MKILLFDYKSFGSKYILLRISVNTNVPNLVQVDSNSLEREHGMVRADRKTAPADRGFRGRGPWLDFASVPDRANSHH